MDVNRAREPAIAIGIIAIAGCVCAALVFAPSPVLRLGASVLLVLFLPGWPLLQALVPQQEPKLATLVFAVGLSLIVTIFAGLGLHFIGAMSRTGWAMALLAATLSACLGAHVRRQSPLVGTPGSVAPSLRPAQAAMLIGAALFTVSAVLLARAEAIERREFVYTEFWMVPDGDGLLALGIRNEEAAPSRYDVEVEVNGALARKWSGIYLGVGESWTADLVAPIGAQQRDRSLHGAEARLFKDGDQRRVYRRVWLPATGED
ncbi:MAG TPA: DUF1616 domain-containing protein [Xanthobacteraceae bacterium]|jgi:hypothetical protein|nr:DUF1616 domain-containing protein [Xanthobacteraceae bacterium]